MAYKFVISKLSYNALTETDPDNLVFSSDYNTLKYYSSGSISITVDYSDYIDTETDFFGTWYIHRETNSVSHNLSYTPFFIVYVEIPSGVTGSAMCPYNFYDVGFRLYLQGYADSTKIYVVAEIRNQSNSGTQTFNFDYKIFKNDIGL